MPAPLREKLALALAGAKSIDAIATAVNSAPRRLQQSLATVPASSREGGELLLRAIADGKAPALLLRDKPLADRLQAARIPDLDVRVARLTANLPPANAGIDRLISPRAAAFDPAKASAARGAGVFARNCAVCQVIEGKGGMLGPQLDDISGRGPDGLPEDILDPDRNVDRTFRMTVVTLKNDSVAGGRFRREQGAELVFADATARETRIAKEDITDRKETETSLMPPIFGESIIPRRDERPPCLPARQTGGESAAGLSCAKPVNGLLATAALSRSVSLVIAFAVTRLPFRVPREDPEHHAENSERLASEPFADLA